MPPHSKSSIKNEAGALFTFADKLKEAARNPDIHRYAPHDKQVRFHQSSAPKKQFVGGNRSGKTKGGAAEACWYSIGNHPFKQLPWSAPTRGRIVTVDIVQGIEKIVKPEIKTLMPKSMLINGSWDDSYDKALRTLTLSNGSFIEFMTYEQELEKFAGTSRHWVWFDEEPPKDIFVECLLRLVDTAGHWWMTMTPVDGMTWTYDDIFEKAGIDPDLLVLEVDMDDNPHLTQAGKDLVLTGLSTEDREARQHGRYISIGGLIYPEFNEDIHVINPISTPPGWLRFDCMDHGLRNPTAWLFCCVDREGRIIVLDEHYRSGWIVKQHVPIVLAKDALYGEPAYRVGDPSIGNRDPITGTSVQLEYVLNGIPIILGNNDVAGGINRVKTLLRGTSVGDRLVPQLYITNNCVNTIREHKKYRWRKWAHKQLNYEKNQPEEPVKKDDHTADALRYGVASRPEVDDGTTVPDASSLPLGMEAIDPDKPFYDNELVSQGTKYQDFNLGEEY